MDVTIKTRMSTHEAVRLANRYLPTLARNVMDQTVLNFKAGQTTKGRALHVPKRKSGEFASKGGIRKLLKASKAGSKGLGGAGIDTGTLFAHLAGRKWYSLGSSALFVNPVINLSGSRPDGVALQSYYAKYRDKYAGGSIGGLNAKSINSIVKTLRTAATKGS